MTHFCKLVDLMDGYDFFVNPATVRLVKPNTQDGEEESSILEFTNGDSNSVAGSPSEVMLLLGKI